jgi:hypothetical protein
MEGAATGTLGAAGASIARNLNCSRYIPDSPRLRLSCQGNFYKYPDHKIQDADGKTSARGQSRAISRVSLWVAMSSLSPRPHDMPVEDLPCTDTLVNVWNVLCMTVLCTADRPVLKISVAIRRYTVWSSLIEHWRMPAIKCIFSKVWWATPAQGNHRAQVLKGRVFTDITRR